jgi:hypothetical protein
MNTQSWPVSGVGPRTTAGARHGHPDPAAAPAVPNT